MAFRSCLAFHSLSDLPDPSRTAHADNHGMLTNYTGLPRSLAYDSGWLARQVADEHNLLRRLLGAPKEADSYAIMELKPDAKGADVKRRYMRLSLLIHPDKCSHPQAQHAFQAVSKASKMLQACPASTYWALAWKALYACALFSCRHYLRWGLQCQFPDPSLDGTLME